MSTAPIKEISFKTESKYHIIPCTGGSRTTIEGDAIELKISLPSPTLVSELITRLEGGRKVQNCQIAEIPEGSTERVTTELGDVLVQDIEEIRGTAVGVVPDGTPGLSGFIMRLVLKPVT